MRRPDPVLVGEERLPEGSRLECDACSAKATTVVKLGEREFSVASSHKVCDRHAAMGRRKAGKMLRHITTKGEFLNDPEGLRASVAARRAKQHGRHRR